MSRSRASSVKTPVPEDMLRKATLARTSGMRAKYAKRGLAHRGQVDRTTQAMLLRQLYLSHMEGRRFEEALGVAEQMIDVEVMPDVARQDAARACLGLGRQDAAVEHLRLASRVCPGSRRAFHLWTLGSVLYLAGRYSEAVGTLSRASRWGTTDKPLYQAQTALAKVANGDRVRSLRTVRERLAEAPCGQGYGQFVLGELAYRMRDHDAAREYLQRFVTRSTSGRVALAVALEGEVRRAEEILEAIRRQAAQPEQSTDQGTKT